MKYVPHVVGRSGTSGRTRVVPHNHSPHRMRQRASTLGNGSLHSSKVPNNAHGGHELQSMMAPSMVGAFLHHGILSKSRRSSGGSTDRARLHHRRKGFVQPGPGSKNSMPRCPGAWYNHPRPRGPQVQPASDRNPPPTPCESTIPSPPTDGRRFLTPQGQAVKLSDSVRSTPRPHPSTPTVESLLRSPSHSTLPSRLKNLRSTILCSLPFKETQ